MHRIYLFIKFIIVIAVLSVLHIAASSLLPHPYTMINVLFIVFSLYILLFEKGSVVWLAFATHFIIELYGTLPFGITFFAATTATLGGFWLFQAIFTNRSWYTAPALCFSMLVMYRGVYGVLLFLMQGIAKTSIEWMPLFINFGWELLLTTVLVSILYTVLYLIRRPQHQQRSIFMRL